MSYQLLKPSQKLNGRARNLSPAPLLSEICSEALHVPDLSSQPAFLLSLSASGQDGPKSSGKSLVSASCPNYRLARPTAGWATSPTA